MKGNLFIIALFFAMFIGFIFPQGVHLLPFDTITTIGIGIIFFLYGLKIPLVDFKKGLALYRLHIFVQVITFILFPLLVLAFYPVFNEGNALKWWLAFFYLAALPSTVSSSVVMVSLARGNVTGAIFNASISGLIGIIMTPFWLQFFLDSTEGFTTGPIILQLFLQILLPLFLGLALQRFIQSKWQSLLKRTKLFDKIIIALIVYSSFSRAFEMKLFESLGLEGFLLMVLAIAGLFGIVYGVSLGLSKRLHFSKENQITAAFCGSKKSLVHGSAMGKIIFSSAQLSIFLLPIMLYHAFQLIVVALIAEKFARRKPLNSK